MYFDPVKLFSLSGRVNRSTFWALHLLSLLCLGLVGFFGEFVFSSTSGPLELIALLSFIAFYFWIPTATKIKRWHDRDKSGWWMLIGIIPVIGGLWALIETGLLDGTWGGNDYGAPSSGSPFHRPPAVTEFDIYHPFYAEGER